MKVVYEEGDRPDSLEALAELYESDLRQRFPDMAGDVVIGTTFVGANAVTLDGDYTVEELLAIADLQSRMNSVLRDEAKKQEGDEHEGQQQEDGPAQGAEGHADDSHQGEQVVHAPEGITATSPTSAPLPALLSRSAVPASTSFPSPDGQSAEAGSG